MCQDLLVAMVPRVQGAGDGMFSVRIRRAERQAREAETHEGRLGTEPRSSSLSSRELGVLEELACGSSTEGIALKFHVSPHTVRTHIKNIMRKLGAHTRAHAVAIAYAERAIDPDIYAGS